MSRPGVLALSGEAKHFVFSNLPAFRHHLMWIFPLAIVIEAFNQAGHLMNIEWLPTATLVPTLVLYGLFSLAWYKASLEGVHESHEFSVTRTKVNDWKFIFVFLVLSALFLVLFFFLKMGMDKLSVMEPPVAPTLVRIGGMIGAFAILFLMTRLSFILPARAMGTALGWDDFIRSSRRMTWPAVGSILIFVILLGISMTAYSFIVGAVVQSVSQDVQVEGVRTAILGGVLSIPIYAMIFFFCALCATTLSRAYQWGAANNPV